MIIQRQKEKEKKNVYSLGLNKSYSMTAMSWKLMETTRRTDRLSPLSRNFRGTEKSASEFVCLSVLSELLLHTREKAATPEG